MMISPLKRNLTRCILCGRPIIAVMTRRGMSWGVEPDTLAEHECPIHRAPKARKRAAAALVQAEYIRVMGTFGEV